MREVSPKAITAARSASPIDVPRIALPSLSGNRLVVAFVTVLVIGCFAMATLDIESSITRKLEMQNQEDMEKSIDFTREQQGSANPFSAVAYLTLGAVGAAALFLVSRPKGEFRMQPIAIVAACTALSVASVLWSLDPSFSVRRSIACGLMFLGSLGVARLVSLRQLALIAATAAVLYAGAGLLAELAFGNFQPLGRSYRFSGVQHPNEQALLCGVGILAACTLFGNTRRERILQIALLIICVVVLVMTKSRTAAAAALVAALAASAIRLEAKKKMLLAPLGIAVVGLALVLVGLVGESGVNSAGSYAAMGRGKDVSSLTGRIPLWQHVLKESEDTAILGAGYGAFWNAKTTQKISYDLKWNVSHAHSIYLQSYLELGIAGFVVLMWMVLYVLYQSYTDYMATRDPGRLFAFALVILAMVHGLAETSFMTRSIPYFLLIAVLGYLSTAPVMGELSLARKRSRLRRRPTPLATDFS